MSKQNNDTYRVSILITNYNSKKYLKKAMYQLMHQTCDKKLFEVIIVDDGSTDGGEKLCDYYEKKYENVKVVHQPNSGGPSRGRNKGIELAKSDYIFFHDVDDYFGKDAIRRVIEHIDEWHPDIMFLKMASDTGRGLPKSMFDKNYESASPYDDKIIRTIGPWKLYRVEFLRKNKIYFVEKIAMEDAVFNFEAFFRAKKISVASDYDYYYFNYRDDGNNLTLLSMRKDFDFATAERRLKSIHLIDEKIDKYVDKTKNLSNLNYKLIEIIHNSLSSFLTRGCTQEQLDEFYEVTKKWYDEEQANKRDIEKYIDVHTFMKNHNLEDMQKIFTSVHNDSLEAKKENNKIYVPIPVKKEKYLDVSNHLREIGGIQSNLRNIQFDDNKITLKMEVNSVLDTKNIEFLLVPNKNFDEQLSYQTKILSRKLSIVKNINSYKNDISAMMNKYEISVTIDIKDLNKLDYPEVSWTFYVSTGKELKTRVKNECKMFFSKAYLVGDSIIVPDIHNNNFVCYRKISENYENKDGYIKYKKRILNNRIIFSSLLNQPFEVTKSIVRDIEKNKLNVKYSPLKKNIIYVYGDKKIRIPNKLRIYNNKYIKKLNKIKNKIFKK